jgi:hypothetical protein
LWLIWESLELDPRHIAFMGNEFVEVRSVKLVDPKFFFLLLGFLQQDVVLRSV